MMGPAIVLLAAAATGGAYLSEMKNFAASAERHLRFPTTDGEPLAYYGTGDSTPRALRTTAAAMAVYATLGESGVDGGPRYRELALGSFRYLLRSHETGEYLCADGKQWRFSDGFRFAEGCPAWNLIAPGVDRDWRDAWTRLWMSREAPFFPELPERRACPPAGRYDRFAAAAERAYAASCAWRGVPYAPPGRDIRQGGRLGLGHARETSCGRLDGGDWTIDTTVEDSAPRGCDEGVRAVLRRQSRIRRLDAATALVREKVTALRDVELEYGFDSTPYEPGVVKPLCGGAPAAQCLVSLRAGETLYDVLYAVGTNAASLAGASADPASMKLPVVTEEGDETAFWQSLIDAATSAGGGRVTVTGGDHIVAQLELKDNVTLEIPSGARLLAVTNGAAYRWTCGLKAELQQAGVVVAYGATNIALVGGGVIDGRGDLLPRSRALPVRWRNVFFFRCRDVVVDGLALTRPVFWSCFLRECDHVLVRRLAISSHANYNNDGLDLCVSNALVEDCDIDSDDDALVLKNFDAGFVSENVEVRNCRLSSNASFIKFGTETFGRFRNFRIHDCSLAAKTPSGDRDDEGTAAWPGLRGRRNGITGIAVYLADGGTMEDVLVRDIDMGEGVRVPFNIRLGRRNSRADGTPSYLRDIAFERVRMSECAASAVGNYICGVPGLDIENVAIRDCTFRMMACPGSGDRVEREYPERESECPGGALFDGANPGWFLTTRHARGICLENVSLSLEGDGEERPAVVSFEPGAVSATGDPVRIHVRQPRGR